MARIEIREDVESLPGNALVSVDVPVANTPGAGLRVKRKAQKDPYLGRDGWQAQEATLPLEFVETAGGKTTFRLAPPAADHVPHYLLVEVELVGANVAQSMQWPYITPSGSSADSGLGHSAPQPKPTPAPTPPPPSPAPTPAPTPPPTPRPTPAPTTGGDPKKRRRWPIPLALLLLLALALAASYHYKWPVDIAALWGEEDEIDPIETLEERLTRLRTSDFVGDKLYELALEAYRQGDPETAFLALALASNTRNYGPARLMRGKLLDPLHFELGKGPEAPNPNAAAGYYGEAIAAGLTEARELLDRLCAEANNPDSPKAEQLRDLRRNEFCT